MRILLLPHGKRIEYWQSKVAIKQSTVIASPAYKQGEAIQSDIKIYDKIIEYLNDKLRKQLDCFETAVPRNCKPLFINIF